MWDCPDWAAGKLNYCTSVYCHANGKNLLSISRVNPVFRAFFVCCVQREVKGRPYSVINDIVQSCSQALNPWTGPAGSSKQWKIWSWYILGDRPLGELSPIWSSQAWRSCLTSQLASTAAKSRLSFLLVPWLIESISGWDSESLATLCWTDSMERTNELLIRAILWAGYRLGRFEDWPWEPEGRGERTNCPVEEVGERELWQVHQL